MKQEYVIKMKKEKQTDYFVEYIGHTIHCFSYKDALQVYRDNKFLYDDICLTDINGKIIYSKGNYFK